MFMLEDMAIDAIVVVAIMVSAFIFVYILTAIIGGVALPMARPE